MIRLFSNEAFYKALRSNGENNLQSLRKYYGNGKNLRKPGVNFVICSQYCYGRRREREKRETIKGSYLFLSVID